MLKRLLQAFASKRGHTVQEGFRLFEAGDLAGAGAICREILDSDGSLAEAHYLLALIAERELRVDEAIAGFERAAALQPTEPAYVLTLGNLLVWNAGRMDEGIAMLERGAELARGSPSEGDARNDLDRALRQYADTLHQQSDTEAARGVAARLIRQPSDTAARLRRTLMLPPMLESHEAIPMVRERFSAELDDLLAGPVGRLPSPETSIGMTAFYLSYHGLNDAPLLARLGQLVRRCYPDARTDAVRRPARARRRVGFVSTYFQSHSIARTTVGWIRDLPRDRYEVHVVSIAPGAGDPRAEEIRRAADHYTEVPATIEAARDALVAAGLDVLIFADIGMHPLTYYLAYWRMAPLQLVAWGHPSTTGIDSIDGFISAHSLEPAGSESQYTERLVKVGGYFMPSYGRPPRTPAGDRSLLGLPAGVPLYGCPQTLFKLHPDFDRALVSLLSKDERSRVVLIDANAHWARRLRERFARAGGDVRRLIFLPHQTSQGFHELLACCDVLLDPFHFGGNNSSMEGFAFGVPIVTLPAGFLRGRFTVGHYDEMDYHDCVVDTPERYVELAHRLATEPDAREAAHRRILERSPVLFDRPDAGHFLGKALDELVQ
jgi:protein O-GlcNAc transferase